MEVWPYANSAKEHEYVVMVISAEGLGFLREQPLGPAPATCLDLNRDRARRIRVAGDDVDPSTISQGDRSDVPARREFGGYEVLAGDANQRALKPRLSSHGLQRLADQRRPEGPSAGIGLLGAL